MRRTHDTWYCTMFCRIPNDLRWQYQRFFQIMLFMRVFVLAHVPISYPQLPNVPCHPCELRIIHLCVITLVGLQYALACLDQPLTVNLNEWQFEILRALIPPICVLEWESVGTRLCTYWKWLNGKPWNKATIGDLGMNLWEGILLNIAWLHCGLMSRPKHMIP